MAAKQSKQSTGQRRIAKKACLDVNTSTGGCNAATAKQSGDRQSKRSGSKGAPKTRHTNTPLLLEAWFHVQLMHWRLAHYTLPHALQSRVWIHPFSATSINYNVVVHVPIYHRHILSSFFHNAIIVSSKTNRTLIYCGEVRVVWSVQALIIDNGCKCAWYLVHAAGKW